MTNVTKASLAYTATQVRLFPLFCRMRTDAMNIQVRFALCSASVFSRTDNVTDSETFYNSILDLLEDVEEKEEVQNLLNWWNR